MKKTYTTPAMEIIKIKAQQLLAGSQNLGMGSGTQSPDDAEGRYFDDWE